MKRVKKKIVICAIILIALVGIMSVVAKKESTALVLCNKTDEAAEWKLVWSDEFDDETLDLNIWTYDVGKDNWGNEELEYYTEGLNTELVDGNLVITARKEPFGGAEYTSGRIKTMEKLAVQYGRIEARIKLPSGQGIWPAFWMMGVNDYWPRCGEIDIMEAINDCDRDYGNVHWGVNSGEAGKYINTADGGNIRIDNPEDWHIYAFEWDESTLRWYFDDNCFFEFTYDVKKDGQHVFHNPFYMILNVAVGGNWTGAPDDAIFPQSMYVDYVRVYSK